MRFIITLLFFLIALLFLHVNIIAQTYQSKNYSVTDGLSSSEIYHVMQDSKGFMWISTNHGICKYDGYSFISFDITNGLPDNTIFESYEDEKGRIWFISLTGKLSYYSNGIITKYKFNKELNNLRKNSIRMASKTTFMVDSANNIYYTRRAEKPIRVDCNGNTGWLEFSKRDSIQVKINTNNSTFNNYQIVSTELKIEESDNSIIKLKIPLGFYSGLFSISLATKNYIYLSDGYKLLVINRRNKNYKWHHFKEKTIWLSIDNSNTLWIGSFSSGVKGYKNGDLNTPIYHLLNGSSVSSICKDNEGGYWASTLKNGVYYFPSINIKTYPVKHNNLPVSVYTIHPKNNQILFGGNAPFIYSLQNNIVKKLQYSFNPESEVKKIISKGDSLFISVTNNDGKIFLDYNNQIKLLYGYFTNAYFDKSGMISFSGSNGNIFYFNEKGTLNNIAYYEDIFKYAADIEHFDNKMLIGTEKGLFLHDGKKLIHMADSNQLFSNRVTSLAKNNDKLWIGTKGAGLLCKKNNTLTQYTTAHGLPSNSISDIIVCNDTVWISTNKGVTRFYNFPQQDKSQTWSIHNGLTSCEINDIEKHNNHIYVGTNDGLCIINTIASGQNTTPPPIYIKKVEIENKDTLILSNYNVSYKQNNISISFVGINYQRNDKIKYKYRLVGIDDIWKTTDQQIVNYSVLSPGKYTFEVFAINNSGVQSKKPASIKFFIKTPFWRTNWFYFILVLLISVIIILVGFLFFKRRISKMKKENLIKQTLNRYRQHALSAQMNPHFLFNSLNSAQHYILQNSPEMATDYLSDLGMLMRIILNNSTQERISLLDEIKALELYINIEKRRFDNTFTFKKEIDVKIDLQALKIPPLILQPFIENAIHHGLRLKPGAKELLLKIFENSLGIIIMIKDNGIGRKHNYLRKRKQNNHNKTHISLGMEITSKRLEIFKEIYSNLINVEVIDLYNNRFESTGTLVKLYLKKSK